MSKRAAYPVQHPVQHPVLRHESESIARQAAALCLDNKAQDLVVLDLHGVTDVTDYFVIASGTSDTHVRGVAEHVLDGMRAAGFPVLHVEGMQQGRWVLLDFFDVVVHVFHPAQRTFYQLERLWSDAKPLALESQGAA